MDKINYEELSQIIDDIETLLTEQSQKFYDDWDLRKASEIEKFIDIQIPKLRDALEKCKEGDKE